MSRALDSTWASPLFAAAVLVLGLVFFPRTEVFPFAPWTMYSRMKNEGHLTDARVLSCDGIPMTQPTFARELGEFERVSRNVVFRVLMNRFADALRAKSNDATRLQKMAEEQLFGDRSCTYELVWLSYRPLEMLRNGTSRQESLGVFTSQRAAP